MYRLQPQDHTSTAFPSYASPLRTCSGVRCTLLQAACTVSLPNRCVIRQKTAHDAAGTHRHRDYKPVPHATRVMPTAIFTSGAMYSGVPQAVLQSDSVSPSLEYPKSHSFRMAGASPCSRMLSSCREQQEQGRQGEGGCGLGALHSQRMGCATPHICQRQNTLQVPRARRNISSHCFMVP